jgi:hypothetical protein
MGPNGLSGPGRPAEANLLRVVPPGILASANSIISCTTNFQPGCPSILQLFVCFLGERQQCPIRFLQRRMLIILGITNQKLGKVFLRR